MGCDIHIFAEIKKDGRWEKVGEVFESCFDFNHNLIDEPYDGRNYELFSILADVRNGYGFAGCDTGDRLNPIADPKGLPDDLSEELQKEVDPWLDCDGHSFSYFTLKELQDYNWNQTVKVRGCVGVEQYKVFKEQGEPNSWSGGVSGGMVVHVSNEEMEKLIESNSFDLEKSYYTKIEWEKNYQELADFFINKSMAKLQEIAPDGDPEKVRIVFWFDN